MVRLVDDAYTAEEAQAARADAVRAEGFPSAQLHVPDQRLYDLVTELGDIESDLLKLLRERAAHDAGHIADPVYLEICKARAGVTEALAHASSAWVRGSFRAPAPDGAFR